VIDNPNQVTAPIEARSLFEIYQGQLPYNASSELRDWMSHFDQQQVRGLCLTAFRYAVKLCLDQAVNGEPESMQELKV
jgi:hypothetical protein